MLFNFIFYMATLEGHTLRRANETAEEQAQRASQIGADHFKWSKGLFMGSAILIAAGILIDLVTTGGAFTTLHISTAGMRILGLTGVWIAAMRYLQGSSHVRQAKNLRGAHKTQEAKQAF